MHLPTLPEDLKNKEGRKDDDGKLRWDLLPYDAVEKIVEILTFGARKYEPNNWQNNKEWQYQAALMRHFCKYMCDEDYDDESGLLHLAHLACNALFLIWKKIHESD